MEIGNLSQNQIITTFGPGSIIDAKEDSVMGLEDVYKRQELELVNNELGFVSENLAHGMKEEMCIRDRSKSISF